MSLQEKIRDTENYRGHLIKARVMRGWSLENAVAKLEKKTGIDITDVHLNLIERKKRNPSMEVVKGLSELYNLSYEKIIK